MSRKKESRLLVRFILRRQHRPVKDLQGQRASRKLCGHSLSTSLSALFRRWTRRTFQYPQDRKHCAPTACCRWRAKETIDLAKISDCLHVAPIHPEHKSLPRAYNSHKPLLSRRKCAGKNPFLRLALDKTLTKRTMSWKLMAQLQKDSPLPIE